MKRFHFYFDGGHHGSAVADSRAAALRRVTDTFPNLAGRAIVGETFRVADYFDRDDAGRVSPFVQQALAGKLPAKELGR